MENRKFRKHHIVRMDTKDRVRLLGIRNEVTVRKHHTLRRSFGARAEENHRGIVRLCRLHIQKFNEARRQNDRRSKSDEAVEWIYHFIQIFHANELADRAELKVILAAVLQFIQQSPAGKDRMDFRTFNALEDRFNARRKVQMHTGLARSPNTKHHGDAFRRRRKHKSNAFFLASDLL